MPRKKAETPPKTRSRKKATPALDRLSAGELASVLVLLLKRHPELRGEAEAIALELVSTASADQIAGQVRAAVMERLCGVIDEQAPEWTHAIARSAAK